MTSRTPVAVVTLKKIKNSVIGSPTAKVALANDEDFLRTLVECLNANSAGDSTKEETGIRIEVAQILASLAYGPAEAVKCILHANAYQAVLYAISRFKPTEPQELQAAFARALRAVTTACAELIGPSQWGVRPHTSPVRESAKLALDFAFRREVLDVILPLLLSPHIPTSVSIAQLLGSCLRSREYRQAIAEWAPPSERSKEVRPRRGWEKRDSSVSSGRSGWVARSLTSLIQRKDVKLQEAALYALAAVAKDSHDVSVMLRKTTVDAYGMDSPAPLSVVLYLCKQRTSEVQIAAGLCAAHILRASSSGHHHHHPHVLEVNSAIVVIHAMNRMISSSSESSQIRIKACFVLSFLLMDQPELCRVAFERSSLAKLVALVQSITPIDPPSGWDEDEASSISTLREAALTTIATMAIKDDDVRREAADGLRLFPLLGTALGHHALGVRYAACQCIRSLSRSASVMRTSLMDSGLGNSLYQVFAREDEDKLVTYAALMAICNLVVQFSPLRQPFLDRGLAKRLSALMRSEHPELKLNSLWALKNLVCKCPPNIKRGILREIGWSEIDKLLADPDNAIREQALQTVCNFADSEEDVEIVFLELGSEHLLDLIVSALESKNTDVLLQASHTLSNLANGSQEHQEQILAHPRALAALRACLVDAPIEVRRAAVLCVRQLAQGAGRHHELHRSGIVGTLRHICDSGATMSPSTGPGHHTVERQVRDNARVALDAIEHGIAPDQTI